MGSINLASPLLASPTISSPELGQLTDFGTQENLSDDDETTKIAATRTRRNFSLSSLLSPRIKAKAIRRKKSPLCKDDLRISATGEVMVKWTFVGDGACGKTSFLM
jgi:hypothetical protein